MLVPVVPDSNVIINASLGNGNNQALISKPVTVNAALAGYLWTLRAWWFQATTGGANTSTGLNILLHTAAAGATFRFTGVDMPGHFYELLPLQLPIGNVGATVNGFAPFTADDVQIDVAGMTAGTVRIRLWFGLLREGNYLTGL